MDKHTASSWFTVTIEAFGGAIHYIPLDYLKAGIKFDLRIENL